MIATQIQNIQYDKFSEFEKLHAPPPKHILVVVILFYQKTTLNIFLDIPLAPDQPPQRPLCSEHTVQCAHCTVSTLYSEHTVQ